MKSFLPLLAALFFFSLASCDKTDDTPGATLPDTYAEFENVSYSGQLQRIAMLSEMKSLISTVNTGQELDADRLTAMYENSAGANFSVAFEKQIKDKTFAGVADDFNTYISELAEASKSDVQGAPGAAGVIESLDGSRAYLFDENGMEWQQVVEKGLMSACFYYQGTTVYLGEGKMNVDNEVVEPGEGTAMQHHWDESFGYFGVPLNFPSDVDGVIFWGDYCNDRDGMMSTNDVMDAFIKGRFAIGEKDLAMRDEAIAEVREGWEKVTVGTAIHYLNGALEHANDPSRRLHSLSEAVVFAWAIQFNQRAKLDKPTLDLWLENLAGSSSFTEMNLWNITDAEIVTARQRLAAAYGLESMAENL